MREEGRYLALVCNQCATKKQYQTRWGGIVDLRREARSEGWRIGKKTDLCPECSGKKVAS